MVHRDSLLKKGFFPEILPPCFDSTDLPRAFRGIVGALKEHEFHRGRSTQYSRITGTKHDGNRRPYATPNPIPYFGVAQFISHNWKKINRGLSSGTFGISEPRIGSPKDDRSILIPPLSELSESLSKNIKYAPYIVKTDISQYFPSIYTHSISWVAHGIIQSKDDRNPKSKLNKFNALDWFCQQCQDGQTRGLLIGPDAFRIIAEYIATDIDRKLRERASTIIIGAVRHVDDYYIGVRSEVDGITTLSHLRQILQEYELQLNDSKTKIIPGTTPMDDIWAQNLRRLSQEEYHSYDRSSHLIDVAIEESSRINSESPLKLILRRLDIDEVYYSTIWGKIEQKLQRALYHFPHCIDYICLLVAKRFATDGDIDISGWKDTISLNLNKHIKFEHHHEITWLVWLSSVCNIYLSDDLIIGASKIDNPHINALIIAAYTNGMIQAKPPISFGNRLNSTRSDWLPNIIARSFGYTKSSFSGQLKDEFEHLSQKKLILIDFNKHIASMKDRKMEAISRSKYGYDSIDDDEEEDDWALPFGAGDDDINF